MVISKKLIVARTVTICGLGLIVAVELIDLLDSCAHDIRFEEAVSQVIQYCQTGKKPESDQPPS